MAWSCGCAWSRATLTLRLQKWSRFHLHTLSVAPGHLVYPLAWFDDSLLIPRAQHLVGSPIWGWLALSLLWIASEGASGKLPRMESSSSKHARSCCTHILPKVRAQPSYPASSCRRLEDTVPWGDFGDLFGRLIGDGMMLRGGDLR